MTTAAIRARLAARGITDTPPYGCTWCGDEQHHHGSQWAPIIQLHQWEQPSLDVIWERMMRRRADRVTRPATTEERRLAVHADAYTSWPDGDPTCATCHRVDCARYWRIQRHLDSREAQRRAELPPSVYDEEPW
ncbi:hypothetical protein [Streptomyces ortus]|uniref:HNH endonuclease n=1 Tax=Streptomyces ortus TaxID=2867268 RepID=A0ABT3V163_9ACTN|nr:hypothetical protein [Streptomyces ortus]MCX4232033.1 hypothetical protein [Streptomyces ortus]